MRWMRPLRTRIPEHEVCPARRFLRMNMRIFPAVAMCLFVAVLVPIPAHASLRLSNTLAGHPSPYLSMHAKDPTAWQQWSEQAVRYARDDNRLILVSIGYFSCHWCHVMQRESYQNADIANYLNTHFVPVKVDREIEPALDAYLIDFADKTQGQSGWPLNVFLTPDGYPLYATVYLPPKEFLSLLQKLQSLWQEDSAGLRKLAAAEARGGHGPGKPLSQRQQAMQYKMVVEQTAIAIGSPLTGGFGEASKFPSTPQLEFLLKHSVGNSQEMRKFLELTLQQMANQGLRDHLAGGFFRYTVDPSWKTPHFEKMLYDNAQLASVYMHAARVFERKDFDEVARDTLDYMRREMMDARGAMIASFSAIDEKNVEGGYYLWTESQLKSLATEQEWKVYRLYAGMTDSPPLDEGYLPCRAKTKSQLAAELDRPETEVATIVDDVEKKLLAARRQRVLPADRKLLAGWNGLALSAFSEAAGRYPDAGYQATAQSLRNYIMSRLWDGKRLLRAEANGQPMGRVSLEDYAYVAEGLTHWAQLTGKEADYRLARDVADQAWARFYSASGWRQSEPGFIPMEAGSDVLADSAMASPSAVVLRTSLRLASRLKDPSLKSRALGALNSGHPLINSDPFWHASQIGVMLDY